MKNQIIKTFEESINIKTKMIQFLPENIVTAIELMLECFRKGGKILLIGNGGSAADAQHIAAELIGRFKLHREGLPAIALTTNTSILTALTNDFGYEDVFSRQLETLGDEKDILIALTTSGNSPNILQTVKIARKKGIKVIGLTGGTGGELKDTADISIVVPSDNVPRIQESHIMIGHIICEIVENELVGGQYTILH